MKLHVLTLAERLYVESIAEQRAKLPSDKELMYRLNCSRSTIQKTMREWRERTRKNKCFDSRGTTE